MQQLYGRNISRTLCESNQISLFLTQLQLQQNELKLNTQNAQLKAGKKNLKLVTK